MVNDLERLYRTRHAEFVRVARAITGDRERALEAVQDAFANLVRARRSYRGDGSLDAWAWRAVVNAARKSLRRPLVEVGQVDAELEPPPRVSELAPVISALPERQRLVLFLRYYADLDYRTIAEALEIETSTVGTTLNAAHAAVRRALQEVQADG